MANKQLIRDGKKVFAQEIMRVGAGVRCRIVIPGVDGETFDWIDAKELDAAPVYYGPTPREVSPALVVPGPVKVVSPAVRHMNPDVKPAQEAAPSNAALRPSVDVANIDEQLLQDQIAEAEAQLESPEPKLEGLFSPNPPFEVGQKITVNTGDPKTSGEFTISGVADGSND